MQSNTTNPKRDFDTLYAPLHRSILTGNLSGIAQRDNRFEYNVSGGGKFVLWPGSGLQKKNVSRQKDVRTDTEKSGLPHWIVAAERLETSRKYLRTAAQIEANWIEPLAKHLIQRTYHEPHWNGETGYVHAFEKVSLFGIVLVPKRRINYGPIDPKASRDIFIQSALVEGDLDTPLEFFVHNQLVLTEAKKRQDKVRQPDMLKPESARYQFYQERIPDEVFDKRSLEKYAKEHPTQHWFMTFDDLCTKTADVSAFPDKVDTFDIKYRYAPGDADDGLTLLVPQDNIRQLEPARLGWLVPGLMEQKMIALLKSLPKEIRRQIVPIPDTVKEMMSKIRFGEGDLEGQICKEITRLVGRIVVPTDFNVEQLPQELRMNVRVLDTDGGVVGESRDFLSLRKELIPEILGATDDPTSRERKRVEEFYETHKREIKIQIQHLPNGDKLRLYAKTLPNFDFNEEVGLLIAIRAFNEVGNRPTGDCVGEHSPPVEGWHFAQQNDGVVLFPSRGGAEGGSPKTTPPLRGTPPKEGNYRCRPAVGNLPSIVPAVQDVTKLIVPLFESYQQAKLTIERNKPHPAALEAEEHLARLTQPGFLTETDWHYLQEYPRYFRAVPMRFEKLRSGGEAADRQGVAELERYWQKYLERRGLHELADITDPELDVFRWMIEEYRVSLFAQRLGTSIKVSPQRLDKQFEKVRR